MPESTIKPTIFIGADHGGYAAKQTLLAWLSELGHQVIDCGAAELDETDDYPLFAQGVAAEITRAKSAGEMAMGILVCRSGAGMVIAANRFPSVRAVGVFSIEQAVHARAHNDANVIVLSGDWTELSSMQQYISTFLTTPFSQEERHIRRIAMFTPTES